MSQLSIDGVLDDETSQMDSFEFRTPVNAWDDSHKHSYLHEQSTQFYWTRVIISHYSLLETAKKGVMHGGVKATLTKLKSRFWIVQGGQFVRKLLYECVVCRKPHKAPTPPPLAEFRVKEEPPFTYVGIDFVGPLSVKSLNLTVLSDGLDLPLRGVRHQSHPFGSCTKSKS